MTKMRAVAADQDTMTGHQTDQGQVDSRQYVTIEQAAKLCGVSSKTIQRAITAGTLPARYPHKNRCEIAVADLARMRPVQVSGHTSEPLEQRVATLEARVEQLEQVIIALQNKPATPHHPRGAKPRNVPPGRFPARSFRC